MKKILAVTSVFIIGLMLTGALISVFRTKNVTYDDLYPYADKELFMGADLIVKGKIVDESKAFMATHEEINYPHRDYTLEISSYVTGESNVKDNKVLVRVDGGKYKNENVYFSGDPMLEKDKEYLMFLYKNEECDFYYIIYADQSVFEYDGNKLIDERGKLKLFTTDEIEYFAKLI